MKVGLSLLKVTLNVNLLFGVIYFYISEISGNNFELQLNNISHEIFPDHYDINLILTFEDQEENGNATFSGECNVSIIIEETISYIHLHAEKPYIQVTNVTAQKIKTGVVYTVQEFIYDDITHILAFHFTNELLPGRYLLRMMFNGSTNKDAEHFFRKRYTYRKLIEENDMWLILTNLWPTGARRLFPCWDEPKFKTTFNITITHYSYMMVLSNTPKLIKWSEIHNPIHGLMRNTSFRKTPLMSASDIAIIMFDDTMIMPHSSNLWFRSECEDAINFARITLNSIAEYLASKWKIFQKLTKTTRRVLIAGFPYDVVENWGLSFYKESAFVEDDIFENKIMIARFAARAVVDDWLIDVDNPSRWSYLWLNEGIATLLAIDAIDKTAPEFRMLDLFVVQDHHESLRLDSFFMEPLCTTVHTSTFNSHFPCFYYLRAPVLLRMLQYIVTDDVFRKGINTYLNHRLSNFDDFCNVMQDVYNEKQTSNTGLNIAGVMEGWIKLKHVPIVHIIKKTISHQFINIENVDDLKDNVTSLWLPLSAAQLHANFTLRRPWRHFDSHGRLDTWITLQQPNFTWYTLSHPDEWIIGNLQQIGYYRIKYDLKNWRKLVQYLNSSSYINIPVLNRAQLIDDAFYFLTINEGFLSIFLDLTDYLSQETDYIAWYPMFKIFEQISTFLPFEDSTQIKEYMMKMLDVLFSKIDYSEDKNYLTNTLKLEAAKWACIFGSSNCKIEAGNRHYLIFNNFTRTMPWKEWILCKGLMAKDYNWWKMLFDRYLNRTDFNVMQYLACSEDPYIIRNYTELITYNKSIQNSITAKGNKEHIYIFYSIIERHARSTLVLDYILEKLENVKPRYMTTIATLIGIINHVYSHESLDKIYDHLPKYVKQITISLVQKMITRRSVQIENHRLTFQYLM